MSARKMENTIIDLSLFPEVTVNIVGSFCDCEGKQRVWLFGPNYCPIHNTIIVVWRFDESELEVFAQFTIEIFNHATLYWILSRDFGEEVSYDWDNDAVANFIEANMPG